VPKRAVTRLRVEGLVDCPFSAAHEYAEEFLRGAEGGIEIRLPLRDLLPHVSGRLRSPVRLVFATHPDEDESGRLHDAMLLEWTAGTRLFPHFHGTLRLRIASVARTRVTIEGAYRPPLGTFGRLFDRILGRRIAEAAIRDLLDRIAEQMERAEREYAVASGSGA
jgi:hypothetical protein